jgi:hypothetical protein
MPTYSRPTDAALDIRPIALAIGAEINGVRPSGDLPVATMTMIPMHCCAIESCFYAARIISTTLGIRLSPSFWIRSLRIQPSRRSPARKRCSNSTPSYGLDLCRGVPAVRRGVGIPPVGGDTA